MLKWYNNGLSGGVIMLTVKDISLNDIMKFKLFDDTFNDKDAIFFDFNRDKSGLNNWKLEILEYIKKYKNGNCFMSHKIRALISNYCHYYSLYGSITNKDSNPLPDKIFDFYLRKIFVPLFEDSFFDLRKEDIKIFANYIMSKKINEINIPKTYYITGSFVSDELYNHYVKNDKAATCVWDNLSANIYIRKQYLRTEMELFIYFLLCIYHEIRHAYQGYFVFNEYKYLDFNMYMIKKELAIQMYNQDYRNIDMPRILTEFDANIHSVIDISELINTYFPKTTNTFNDQYGSVLDAILHYHDSFLNSSYYKVTPWFKNNFKRENISNTYNDIKNNFHDIIINNPEFLEKFSLYEDIDVEYNADYSRKSSNQLLIDYANKKQKINSDLKANVISEEEAMTRKIRIDDLYANLLFLKPNYKVDKTYVKSKEV
jgi:hypothetical protein